MATRIIFVRHGELEGENSSILHAVNDPVTLSEEGRSTMNNLGDTLASHHIDRIYSSPEIRTTESAQILSASISAPLEFVKELQGRSWGDFADKSWEEVGKILESKTLEERYEFEPPAGESWKQFEYRMLSAIKKICDENESRAVCIVSHGSSIRVLLPKVFNVPVEESLKLYPDYGSISTIEYENGKFINSVFNQRV